MISIVVQSDEDDFKSDISPMYDEINLNSDTDLVDDDSINMVPPTTRWNRQADDSFIEWGRDTTSTMDPTPSITSAATSRSEEWEYRQWQSRVARTTGTRVICWFSSTPFYRRSEVDDLNRSCFVCKLDLDTEPEHLKSFPVQVWMQAANHGCPNCQQITLGIQLAAAAFNLNNKSLHVATTDFDNPSFSGRAPDPSVGYVERISVALFWVDFDGDHSEGLQFERQKKLPRTIETTASENKVAPLASEEYQLSRFQLARELLEMCNREHACRHPTDFLPTRLIFFQDTSNGSAVKLVRSAFLQPKHEVNYTALSYCWGKQLPLRLLQASIEQMEAGIPWAELPRLFQDAMLFTRSLGLTYIWIDALCIIQDDLEDWERESTQMGDIYLNSYVTIGATSSRDSTNALTMTPFQEICLDLKEERQNYEYVKVRSMGGDLTWPLHHRGWAYQEILLPKRYLDFDSNALSLHCCEGTLRPADDSLPSDRRRSSNEDYREWGNRFRSQNFRQPWSFRWFWARILSGVFEDEKGDRIEMWQAWQEVVMMFTNRRLTYTSDRLPAIGGVAAAFLRRSQPGEEYCAGLWKNSFVENLAWETCFQNDLSVGEYQAPSWSWASINDIVDYDQNDYRFEGERHVHTKVIEISVSTKESSPFGSVTGGFARLEGPCSWCKMGRATEKTRESFRHFSVNGIGCSLAGTFLSDTELELVESVDEIGESICSARRVRAQSKSSLPAAGLVGECKVMLLHLQNKRFGGKHTCMVLGVVDVVENELVFQRLGLATVSGSGSGDTEIREGRVMII
jgi:hypothetical protein